MSSFRKRKTQIILIIISLVFVSVPNSPGDDLGYTFLNIRSDLFCSRIGILSGQQSLG